MTTCLALALVVGLLPAQAPTTTPLFTRATLPDMDCMGCAKKASSAVNADNLLSRPFFTLSGDVD